MTSVSIEYVDELPGGLPAVWEHANDGTRLFLRSDLPEPLRRRFVDMATVGRNAA